MTFEEAVSKGQPYRGDKDNSETIDGDRLRRLFLEAEPEGSVDGSPRQRRITPAGIIIYGRKDRPIVLVGGAPRPDEEGNSIDLSYLAGRNGGPLPPLVLRHCIISADLRLSGSHFAFLSIEDCMIARIDADHCQIDNHCRFINLAPARRKGRATISQIRMVGARVHGTVDLRGSRLHAPAPTQETYASRRYADRFALSLASATIDGRLLLDHDFTARGGVSLFQATIRNSLSLNSARLESLDYEVPALDAEELRLAGSLTWVNGAPALRPDDEDQRKDEWHVAGRIILRRAEIGGDVKLEHCRWAETGAFSIKDGPGTRTGKRVDHISGGIDARALNVAGQLRIGEGCRVARWRAPPARRAEEDVGSGVFGPSLDGWKALIGKGVRIEGGKTPALFLGPIFLNDSNIDHGIIMLGAVKLPEVDVATEKIAEAFDLSDARVKGLVRMRCTLSGSAVLRRASIEGTVELQKLEFRRPLLAPGNPDKDCETGMATLLDLSSTMISGALHLGGLSMEEPQAGSGIRRALARREMSMEPLSSAKAEIGTEYRLENDIAIWIGSLRPGDPPELLTGEAEQLRQMFARHRPRTSARSVREFARLRLRHVVEDHGINTVRRLGRPKRCGDDWLLRNCEFRHSGSLHKADLVIDETYKLEVRNERETARDDAITPQDHFRIGPFRFPRAVRARQGAVQNAGLVAPAIAAYFETHAPRQVIIDLRGLTCRTFDDVEASAWAQLGDQREWRLLLDGIGFSQFDRTDPKERSAPIKAAAEASPAPPAPAGRPPVKRNLWQRAIRLVAAGASKLPNPRTDMLHSVVAGQDVAGWAGVSPLAENREYSPQPFETFARAYIRSGDHAEADDVISAQKRLEWMNIHNASRKHITQYKGRMAVWTALWALGFSLAIFLTFFLFPRTNPSPGIIIGYFLILWAMGFFLILWGTFYGAVRSWPYLLIFIGWLFDKAFRFGLKPARAVQTLTLCLLLGVIGANVLSSFITPVESIHHVHVIRTYLNGRHAEYAQAEVPADVAVEGCNVVSGSFLDRAVYAFDVFVPLIDVRQECAFTIAPGSDWIRWLKALYAALGWIVVSLTLLTISGVLRRDLEK
jgi:hypothetical protein